jgi:outer membrane protein TolC
VPTVPVDGGELMVLIDQMERRRLDVVACEAEMHKMQIEFSTRLDQLRNQAAQSQAAYRAARTSIRSRLGLPQDPAINAVDESMSIDQIFKSFNEQFGGFFKD